MLPVRYRKGQRYVTLDPIAAAQVEFIRRKGAINHVILTNAEATRGDILKVASKYVHTFHIDGSGIYGDDTEPVFFGAAFLRKLVEVERGMWVVCVIGSEYSHDPEVDC